MRPTFEYVLRRGGYADARTVLKIFLAALDEHGFARTWANVNPEIATFGLSDPSRDEFVVASRGKVVGFVILLPAADRTGELAKLFVAPSHRGRGVAKLLMDSAVDAAKARKYSGLTLETRVEFTGALPYYERHGWVCAAPLASSPLRTYGLDLRERDEPAHASFWATALAAVLRYLAKATQRQLHLTRRLNALGRDEAGLA